MSEIKRLPPSPSGDDGFSGPEKRSAGRVPFWDARPKLPKDNRMRALMALTVVAFLVPRMFFTIQAGEVGVVFHRWGGTAVSPHTERDEGFHVISPWDVMEIYEVRIQRSVEELKVLSKEGLEVRIVATVLYRPIKEKIGLLHREIGPEYLERVVRPETHSILRVLASRRTAEEIFTAQRDLQADAFEGAQSVLSERYVRIESLLVTEVILPEAVQRAIDEKQKQAQVAQEYDFRIIQEEKEATRKEIEAQGIKEFETTVASGLTEPFLRWRTIDATLELARSPNSKWSCSGARPAPRPSS